MATDALDRKLAAILYADVVGYSRLTGADEDGTHRLLSEYLDAISLAIQSHRGRVVHYAGDAVLADFSTVSDALSCAVAIQDDLKVRNQNLPDERQMTFRIGLNLGEVIVDRDDIYGDGVNVAARLESLAEPGGICISGTVYDAIGNKLASLHYAFMGEQTVKNIAQPVRAYRVEAAGESARAAPPCPYPGMVPFAAKDAAHFYGRDQEISQMVQLLRRQRFLMVIGPSGSGKSSLVYAGLLPKLEESRYFNKGYWLIHTMRPGTQPSEVLTGVLNTDGKHGEFDIGTVDALLEAHPPAERLLLLVDQFEEVFTQAGREERARFIAELQALRAPENCALILTLRADFYPDLMTSYLWPVDASQRVEVAPLRGDALREAIEKPAADVGVRLEESLVHQLLADAADEPGVLPLLQETMGLLWDEMDERVLSYQAYEQLSASAAQLKGGGLSGLAVAIAMKADAALAAFNPAQQAIARRIFLRLIQFGEGRADTRRQQPIDALRAANDAPGEFEQTLEHLTDHRLLTRSGGDDDHPPVVDISHESLINGWSRLQDWADERREAEQIRRRLEGKAAEWVRLGQGSGGLLDEAELPEAERWLGSPDAADLGFDATLPALVKASQRAITDAEQAREAARQRELMQAQALADEQRRAARRMRRSMIGLAAVLLVAVVAGLFAWTQSQKAQTLAEQEALARQAAETSRIEAQRLAQAEATARKEAEQARFSSIAQLLLIEAQEQQAIDLDERGALLARQAYLFTTASRRNLQQQVDGVLRSVVAKPYFSALFSQESTQSVALSPDGNTLAAVHAATDQVLLWDLSRQGSPPIQLPGYPGDSSLSFVYALAFSPDGKTLAAGNESGGISLWQIEQPDGAPRELLTHAGVWSVAFGPDSRYLAAGANQDDVVQLWDLGHPESDPVLVRDTQATAAGTPPPDPWLGVPVAFSSDGTLLASAGTHGTIQLWDRNDLDAPRNSLRGHEGGVYALAFSGDSKTLVSGGQDTTVRLWDLSATDTSPVILHGDGKPVISVAFSPAGELLVSSGQWSGILLRQLKTLDAPPLALLSNTTNISFSADGKRMASARLAGDGVRLWDLTPSGQSIVIAAHENAVMGLAFSPDGSLLASSGDEEKTIHLWDLTDLSAPAHSLQSPDGARTPAFSPHGQWLAVSGGLADTVRVWALGQDLVEQAVLAAPGQPHDVTFSPDGKLLAAGSGQGVYLWDTADLSAEPQIIDFGNSWLVDIAFSPDQKLLAASGEDGFVYLQALADLQAAAVKWQEHESRVLSVAFSPDGNMLVSGGRDTTLRLWDPHTPEKPSRLIGRHDNSVSRVRFSPDGKRLASTAMDHSLRLWNMEDLDAVPALLLDEKSSFLSVRFSPDGKTMATGSWDGTIRLWDMTHPLLLLSTAGIADRVCEKVWRNLTLEEWHQFVGEDIPYERTCPNLPIHPSLFGTAEKLAKAGDKASAVVLLERAAELDPELALNPQEEVERWTTPDDN